MDKDVAKCVGNYLLFPEITCGLVVFYKYKNSENV
jgi:hypothetical protein